jgi:hypothetical protein
MTRTAASEVSYGLLLTALLVSPQVWAWPVERVVEVTGSDPVFLKLGTLGFAELEDSRVASAEVLPTGELMILGEAPGETVLLAYGAEPTFLRVRVSGVSPPPQAEMRGSLSSGSASQAQSGESRTESAARSAPPQGKTSRGHASDPGRLAGSQSQGKPSSPEGTPDPRAALVRTTQACPGLKVSSDGTQKQLESRVESEACRLALRELFQSSDEFLSPALDLTFDVPTLQAQLKEVAAALAKVAPKLEVSYLGTGAVLKGAATATEHRQALWALFHSAVGRISLNDQVDVPATKATELIVDGDHTGSASP